MPDAHSLVSQLGLSAREHDVQLVQTRFRQELVAAWRLTPGSRVLEIGCGQGDMTLAIAAAVGPDGHVTAIDAAKASSGSPSTFAAAADRIQRSAHGHVITFLFDTDIFAPQLTLPLPQYDYAILAHSSWYFASLDLLHRTLERLATWSTRLCLSEWDLQPTGVAQISHLLAALLQGATAAQVPDIGGNIRTLLSRPAVERIVEAAGWHIDERGSVDSSELHDARWEIMNCLALITSDREYDVDRLLGLDVDAISALLRSSDLQSLSSFVLTCHRP